MNLEDLADRDRAEQHPCPLCGAEPGTTCTNLATGEPLVRLAAHLARLNLAGIVHAPLDRRELEARHERTPRS